MSILLSFVLLGVCVVAAVDPDAFRTFEEIITSKGFPCETHFATTGDGYILRLFRIPFGSNNSTRHGKPVLLQHGVVDSAFTWIINSPTESLPYILANAGFDVWMGNNRGSRYSINHTTLNVKDKQYWEFTWDQMASQDFPTQVDYILNTTGYADLSYIGHSEGTIQFFAGLAVNPSFAQKINFFGGLGPVMTVGSIGATLIRIIADTNFDEILNFFGHQFLPTPVKLHTIFVDFCVVCEACCANSIEAICGKHKGAFNDTRMPVMAANEPGGTSTMNVIHWAQGVKSKKFQMYDYGRAGNLEHYHSVYPPEYNMANFPKSVPVALYSGAKDLLADPSDVSFLVQTLKSVDANLVDWLELPTYAHLDFVWDYNAAHDFYTRILTFLQKYNT